MVGLRLLRFDAGVGRQIEHHGSDFRIAPLGRGAPVQASCMHLPPGGRVGWHEGTVRQVWAVVAGSAWVRGGGEARQLEVGQAALWESGEEHESWTDEGCTALVLEGEGLEADWHFIS